MTKTTEPGMHALRDWLSGALAQIHPNSTKSIRKLLDIMDASTNQEERQRAAEAIVEIMTPSPPSIGWKLVSEILKDLKENERET